MKALKPVMSTADRLRKIRELKGLTQAQFAAEVGLTQSAISQFEDGRRSPSIESLIGISMALNVPLDKLIDLGWESDCDVEKEVAIAGLEKLLKNADVSAEEIVAMTKYFEARLGD